MPDDPFETLGLPGDASADDVRAARRRLAKRHHPDAGGDPEDMRRVNAAAVAALRRVGADTIDDDAPPAAGEPRDGAPPRPEREWTGVTSDVPSFVVEALPAETFEALLVVAGEVGEVLDDDPPYRLDAYLDPPMDCWCRLELVPDAGASTVSITVGALDPGDGPRRPPPDVEAVRDVWVERLNRLDW